MKKSLLCLALGLTGIFSVPCASAKQLIGGALDRTGWTVRGCSEHNANGEGHDGGFRHIIDDNANTFWHSQYGDAGHTVSCPHYFYIDRGENFADQPSFNAFGYLPRQGAGNGFVQDYRLYVLDSVDGLNAADVAADGSASIVSDDHASLTDFLADKEPLVSGTLDCVYSNECKRVLRTVSFPEQTGRYILFVIDSTNSSAGNNLHANCAEFFLYNGTEDVNIDIYKSMVDAIAGFTTATELADIKATMDEITSANGLNIFAKTALSSRVEMFIGHPVTIQNVRRLNTGNDSYLTTQSSSEFANTSNGQTNASTWMFKKDDNGNVCLYNMNANKYMSSDLVNESNSYRNPINAEISGAMHFKFDVNLNANHPGIGLHCVTYNDYWYVNLDNNGSNACMYSELNDAGSSWKISPATVAADQLDTTGATKYRIRSARGLHNNLTLGTIGVNVTLENGEPAAQYTVNGMNDGLGTLWTIKDAGNGNVYINSVLADFEGNDSPYGITGEDISTPKSTSCIVSATPSAVKVVTAKGAPNSSFNKNNFALAILTNEEGHYYMDNSGTTPKFNGWTTVDNNYPQNGGIYYFEPADDAQEMIDEYLSAANALTSNNAAKATVDLYEQFPALWTAEDIATARKELEACPSLEITTIKQAHKNQGVNNTEAYNAVINSLKNKADGKTVQFENIDRNNGSGNFMSHGEASYKDINEVVHTDSDIAITTDEANDRATLWTLINNPETNAFKLLNYHTGKYIQNVSYQETSLPMVDEADASEFFIEPSFSCGIHADEVVLQIRNGECLHEHGDVGGYRIVKWSNAAGSGASGWRALALEEAQVEFAKAEGGHTMTLGEGVTLNDHASAEGLSMTITKLPEESEVAIASIEPADGVHTISAADFENGTVNLAGLTTGKYEVSAPAGMFLVNGKHANLKSTFTVDTNGDPLAIDEIEAANAGATVIYDLQGRRVNRAVHGIYIVNGRKVIL